MAAITILIIGAGDRGTAYASYAGCRSDLVSIAEVADSRPYYRDRVAALYGVPASRVFADWREALAGPGMADAVVIATSVREHAASAIAAAERGYHVLFEDTA
ncbi:MAG TPA: Gfo/Idh/MocA family oxidoreductase [Rhodothermia bacterium]